MKITCIGDTVAQKLPTCFDICRDAHITSQPLRISARYSRVSKSLESWLSNDILFVEICKETIEI
jgi:hypothetical protein